MGSHRNTSTTETGSISRKTLVMSAATLIPVGIISLSLYSAALPGSPANKVEVRLTDGAVTPTASKPQDKPATEASPATDTSASKSNGISVEVNGQNIPIPENGNLSQTIPTENGTVDVQVQDDTANQGDDNQSSIRVNIDSGSSGGGDENFETETRTRIRIRER